MFPLHDDNPITITPLVTIGLIILCVLVFVYQFSIGEENYYVIRAFGLIPISLFDNAHLAPAGAVLPPDRTVVSPQMTIFTSMFLHGGWMHLIGNMLYLWIFGNNIEDAMGHVKFLAFYLACGFAAALAQVITDPNSFIPMIGASGAVSGVLGAYTLLHPNARIRVLIFLGFFTRLMHVKAIWVLGFWFLYQVLAPLLAGGSEGGGVAYAAHIGGFIAGLALIPFFKDAHIPIQNPLKHLSR
jgi:membrane associated rhomboid family serine protease